MQDDNGYRPPPPFSPPSLRRDPVGVGAPAPAALLPPSPQPGRRLLVAFVALAGALAVAGALLSLDRLNSSLRSLSLPRHVAAYTLQRTLTATEIGALAASGGFAGFGAAELRSARIGLYGERPLTRPTLILVGLSARADPDVRARLAASDPADLVDDVLASFGSAPTRPADPGPLGGAMACAPVLANGTAGSLGVWADRSTVGVLELMEPRTTVATARLTRRFRAASEH